MDTHFKYLLIAGLQDNISLRKLSFINPGLDADTYPKESKRFRDNLFGILRKELEERQVIEMVPATTMRFLFSNDARKTIGRGYTSKLVRIEDPLGQTLSDLWRP